MASLIPGFEYDIFISYRQKDNLYDGWVTEFVSNLKKELEATFKEDISVYFDINPHDGLLETHDVDASLKNKLKCVIFIPIISRTYCDPKSFAWEQEFKAFIDQASNDQYGLKVKLPNGNVTSRVLPVRIHELDNEDIILCESVLGGVLRGIEFIYKESGFNRPIKPDDDEKINLNKTKYRNQITKVALAIKEIISGMRTEPDLKVSEETKDLLKESKSEREVREKTGSRIVRQKPKKWLMITLSLLLLAIGVFAVYKVTYRGKQAENVAKLDKSIAVLPFANDSPDKDNEYFCNGMMDEILGQLQKIGDLKVKSRTSVEKYRNPDKDIKVIGQELGVAFIMEGSVRKVGDDIRITAQLIDAKTGNHLWSEIYDWKYTTEIFKYQSGVAKKVATSLHALITPEEKSRIDKKPTSDMRAYDLCVKAWDIIKSFDMADDSSQGKSKFMISVNLFNQALQIDPLYTQALNGKSHVFWWVGINDSALIYGKKALATDPTNPYTMQRLATVYQTLDKPDSSNIYLKKSLDQGANDCWTYLLLGQRSFYGNNGEIEALKYYQKAYDADGGDNSSVNSHISWLFEKIGDYPMALKYGYKALSQKSNCYKIYSYDYLLFNYGKYNEALQFIDSACSVNACEAICLASKFFNYTIQKDFDKAEQYYKKYSNLNTGITFNGYADIFLAYLYKETGRKNEAFSILNKLIIAKEKAKDDLKDAKWQITAAYATLDENKKVLQYLNELEKVGFWQRICSIKTFPGFDNLRNDPEFKAIVKRIDDKNAALREKVDKMRQRGEIDL